jgi:hypothetical protein
MTDLGVLSPVRSVLSLDEVPPLPVVGGSVGIADGRATPGAVHCGDDSFGTIGSVSVPGGW